MSKALAAAILPCPFCGLAPDTEIYRRNTGEFYRGAIYYFCEDHTDLMSLEHWNRRAQAAVPISELQHIVDNVSALKDLRIKLQQLIHRYQPTEAEHD